MGPWVLADATKHGVNVSKFKVDFVANIASSIASIDKDPIGNFQSRVQAILPKSSLPGFGVLVRSISNASTSGDVDKAIAVEVRRALSDRGFTETNRNSYLCCLAVFHYSNNLWSKNSQK